MLYITDIYAVQHTWIVPAGNPSYKRLHPLLLEEWVLLHTDENEDMDPGDCWDPVPYEQTRSDD